jgi:glycerol-3-phosphate acyltransferase PlsY
MLRFILVAAVSYLLGSIPVGYLLVRAFRGSDIRNSGSGNIGATNVARTSPLLGITTLVLDALKGFAAVLITRYWIAPSATVSLLMGAAAVFAVIGHIFPVWLKFRGGKGVATGLGSFLVIAPKAILVMMGIFLAVVLAFRYVSLGSIVVAAAFPFLAWVLDGHRHIPAMFGCTAIAALLIIAKHEGNIRRLLSGTENRFELRRG